MNTNGENVKNKSTFAKRRFAKLSINSFIVNPLSPARKPKASVDTLVTAVKINTQTKNMMYLEARNFPRDIGMVSIAFKVCSLYSLPKR